MDKSILWILAFHLFGVLVWTGAMITALHSLEVHAKADAAGRPLFQALERRSAMAMDLGATIAIVCGILLITKLPDAMKHGYMHAKLALVAVVFLGGHGFVRVQIRKFRQGQVREIPPFVIPAVIVTALATIILIVVKPF